MLLQPKHNLHGRSRLCGRHLSAWLLAVVMALTAASCSTSSDGPSNELGRNQHLDVVDALAAQLPELLRQYTRSRADRLTIETILQEPSEHLEGVTLERPEYLERLYSRRDYQPLWIEIDAEVASMTPAGFDLLEVLNEGVGVHGLWPDELHLGQLDDVELPGRRHLGGETFAGVALDDQRRGEILDWLAQSERTYGADADHQELLGDLVAPDAPLGHLNEPVQTQIERLSRLSRETGRIDVLLSDAMIHYALRMHFENPAWQRGYRFPERLQPKEELADRAAEEGGQAGDDASDAPEEPAMTAEELEQARRAHMVVEALAPVFEEPSLVGSVLGEFAPRFEPYRRLTDAFIRYEGIVDEGGWPEIPEAAEGLRRGAESEHIPVVKERLRIEGYFDGDDSETFTNELRRAMLTYQATHQLWENGWLTPQTLRSLNVTATERWNQIRLTLQRWRESRIGPDEHFAHVNISDFHAAVWRDGERQLYFKVIVGSTTREENDDGELVLKHATPRFSDQIENIVFQPYWNVPQSIREQELEPKFEEDPEYFDKKGYEYATYDNGRRYLRQKPGPTNALGKVKFIFPNRYAVYMHDTPDKKLFDHPFRAYSHGCIRVENPMEFAHYLLDLDGRWKDEKREEKLTEWFEEEGETWINLRTKLPVHIEYYVVRVDDDGHANFLADLYRLDRPRLKRIARKLEQIEGTKAEAIENLEYEMDSRVDKDAPVDQQVAP